MPRSLASVVELVFWWVFCTEHQCVLGWGAYRGACTDFLTTKSGCFIWLIHCLQFWSEQIWCRNHDCYVLFKDCFSCGYCSYYKYEVPCSRLCIPNVGCLCYLKVPAVVLEIVKPKMIVLMLLLKCFIYVYENECEICVKVFGRCDLKGCWYIVHLYSMNSGNVSFLINLTSLWSGWISECVVVNLWIWNRIWCFCSVYKELLSVQTYQCVIYFHITFCIWVIAG